MRNGVDGKGLQTLTLSTLETEYGMSNEDDRKKIVYSIKDILKKDNYRGNTNDWQNFLMWLLPLAGARSTPAATTSPHHKYRQPSLARRPAA
jgi:hypothetical protein